MTTKTSQDYKVALRFLFESWRWNLTERLCCLQLPSCADCFRRNVWFWSAVLWLRVRMQQHSRIALRHAACQTVGSTRWQHILPTLHWPKYFTSGVSHGNTDICENVKQWILTYSIFSNSYFSCADQKNWTENEEWESDRRQKIFVSNQKIQSHFRRLWTWP